MAITGKGANAPTTARSASAARGGFRADIQGLRAVAVVLVVIYHADFGLPGGYVGVDVFFVISGFLITSQLVDELASQRRISLLSFYARRVRRILPAATVTIVTTVIVARLVLVPIAAQRVFEDAMTSVFYGANFRFAIVGANYLNSTLPPSPIQHFWSLAVEEQFYLVWPVILIGSSLVWLGRNRQHPRHQEAGRTGEDSADGRAAPDFALMAAVLVMLAAVSFFVSVHETVSSPTWAYYSIFSRAWELAAGALAALARPYAVRLWPPLASALTVKSRKQTRIPSVWGPADVTRVLEAVDRGNPCGKRDYAIILLVTRLGLRGIDVKRLEFSDFDWPANRLAVVQAKTGQRVWLPLLKDVGWAVIDYIRSGRPACACPQVFIRHTAPIGPFSDQDHLHQILVKYARAAHVPVSEKRRHGMHSLRHTLATQLRFWFAEGQDVGALLPVLQTYMGHSSLGDTAYYLRLTAESYPDITARAHQATGDVVAPPTPWAAP